MYNKFNILNAVLFQVGWFSLILLPIQFAAVVAVLILGVHFYLVADLSKEIKFIFPVAILGYLMDLLFEMTGFINFTPNGGTTLYLLLIWFLFAMTLRWSFKFSLKSPGIAFIVGVLAPLSYLGAQKFGRVEFSEPFLLSILTQLLIWGIFMLIVQKIVSGNYLGSFDEKQ